MKDSARLIALVAVLALAGCVNEKPADTAPGTPAAAAAPAKPSAGGTVAKTSKYDAGPRAGESSADHEAAERGEKLFQTRACSACHAFGKRMSGPDLAGVSMRRTAAWMEHQILTPEVMVKEDPISRELFAKHALQMPNQGLTPEQAKDIIEFLKHKDAKTASGGEEESK